MSSTNQASLHRPPNWSLRRNLQARQASPDSDAIVRLEIKLVAWLYAPGLIPGVDVAHRPVNAEAGGRMRIGRDLSLECIEAGLVAPDLRPAQEDPLLAGETVEHRSWLAVERGVISVQREQKTAQVGNVLAHGQGAVDVHAGCDRIGIELRTVLFSLGLESGVVGRQPPVSLHAMAVELAALIVEPMRHLVTDHATDAAIVDRLVGVRIKERRL